MAKDETRGRPERVIILDADDPMTEVTGHFVWQDEHERVVEEIRREAFQAGFEAGLREARPAAPPSTLRVEVGRRRTLGRGLKLALFALGLLCALIALPVLVLAG